MMDDKNKHPEERQIVLRAGRKRGLDTKLRGKSNCPGCGELIFGQPKKCRYCDYDFTAAPAAKATEEPKAQKLGEVRVDKRAKEISGSDTKKWGFFGKSSKKAAKTPAKQKAPAQNSALPKHLQHLHTTASAKPKKKEPEYDPNMVDGMEISFAGEKSKLEQDSLEMDLATPEISKMSDPISIPWERLLGYLLVAVVGFAGNYFLGESEGNTRDNPEYQKAVQSLCREYCAHEKMTRVETGQLHREDTEFLANCMYLCFRSGGDTARGDAAHHGSRLDREK